MACYYYWIASSNYKELEERIHSSDTFEYNYWIPQVDINDSSTDFYDNETINKYVKLIYYSMLLIIGNDIMPQTNTEVVFCSAMLVLGAFLVAVSFAGMSAEMEKADNKT